MQFRWILKVKEKRKGRKEDGGAVWPASVKATPNGMFFVLEEDKRW